MDPNLASRAGNLPLVSCRDLLRYSNCPLLLSNSCRDFAVHFLKLITSYSVPVMPRSTSKYPCCVEICAPAETTSTTERNDLRTSLNKVRGVCNLLISHSRCFSQVLSRIAKSQVKRDRFPWHFKDAEGELQSHISSLDPFQLAQYSEKKGQMNDWNCEVHTHLLKASPQQQEAWTKETETIETVHLWMTPMDRIGVIALIINGDPKLPAFVRPQGVCACVRV